MQIGSIIDARKEPFARVVEEVAAVILGGGTAIFPTDTVYAIGCDPYNVQAVHKLYAAKRRPAYKPLSLHLATPTEFLEYVRDHSEAAAAGRRLFPGPVTIIVRRPSFIDKEVTSGFATLGFRVPDDALCSAILERCGPVAATSANVSGSPAYRGSGDLSQLPDADILIENGATRYGTESTVIDFSGSEPVLLREGVIKAEQLSELLDPVFHHPVMLRKTT